MRHHGHLQMKTPRLRTVEGLGQTHTADLESPHPADQTCLSVFKIERLFLRLPCIRRWAEEKLNSLHNCKPIFTALVWTIIFLGPTIDVFQRGETMLELHLRGSTNVTEMQSGKGSHPKYFNNSFSQTVT